MRIANPFRNWAFRVVAIYAVLFAVSVLTLLAFIYVTTVGFIDRQINASIITQENSLAERYDDRGLPGLIELIGERTQGDRIGDELYLLTDGDYQPVAGNLPSWPSGAERQGRWMIFHVESQGDGPAIDGRGMSTTFPDGYRILIGRNLRERENFERLIFQSLVWSLIVTAVLALGGGLIMSRDVRVRLEAINRTTRQIMRGEFKQRIPVVGSGDEFDRLSNNLNAMLDQIDRLMHAMREVSDNVAHDLRSPLTRLKTKLEVTLLTNKKADQLRAAIEQAVAETDGILGTFNALLSIAQAESGSGRGEMKPVDLALLCGDVGELYGPVAEAKAIRLDTAITGALTIDGNRHLLFQALTNLVDNAIKYSPAGAAIRLELRRVEDRLGGDAIEVVVADTGPGIPAMDRENVLRRFVRLDQSRSTPGNGLGLSLVPAVMSLHGGTLRLEDNEPGLRAVLRFPEAPALKLAG